MRAYLGIMIVSLGFAGCFYMPVVSKGKVSTLDESPRIAATVATSESKAVSVFDPNSKVATTIPAPSGALAGSSVTLPAGALAISTQLVVEEAVPLSQTSVATSLAISSDISIKPVGSGLIIRPAENVDLTKPLTIAMPINPLGLRGWLATTKYYTIFYKYFVNGELKAGAIPTSELRFSETDTVLFEGYFGAYWLAEVSAPIEQKVEVPTSEPIVNKDNVAVVTNTGIVTEAEVLVKTALPPVTWQGVTLTFDAAQRTVTAKAAVDGGRSVTGCQVDLFEKTDASSGINLDAGSNLLVTYKIAKQEAHTLYARFRCLDDESRQTMSSWSTAVSIPGAAPAPVVTQPTSDFCKASAPEIRLSTNAFTSAGGLVSKAFTSLGNCVYTVELDAMWGANFGIATADGKTRCFANQQPYLGSQTISCMASADTTPNMWLPSGNYTIKLDFSLSASSPAMSIGLQPCTIGDLFVLTTNDTLNWPAPAASNRMTHLGGCQYTGQASKAGESMTYVRIQNANGSYSCGDGSYLTSGSQKNISCGSTPGHYTQTASGSYIVGFKYLLNLGTNLDMSGQTTSTPYLWVNDVDKCQENRYLLGPTSAGNNRQPGVNSLMKDNTCTFDYRWIQSGSSFSPFFIGIGEGTSRCGVAPASPLTGKVYLDCSPSAVAIDMQSFVSANGAYRLVVKSDPSTGQPTEAELMPLVHKCLDPLYAVSNATLGFLPSLAASLTEISECIYQYDWIPSATNRSLSFVSANNTSYRCAKFPGFVDPVVNGPSVPANCGISMNSAIDYPFAPIGAVDGQRYKINLDFRLGMSMPRINVASAGFSACPDLYVTNLAGFPSDPHDSNRMTLTGDCNYSFRFQTPTAAPSSYSFQVTDAGGSIQCGRASLDPLTTGETVLMSCSGVTPATFSIPLAQESNYQLNVHYESGGNSTISIAYISHDCYSQLDGPAGLDQNGAYSRWTTKVDQCVEELLWMPTTSVNSFVMKSSGYSNYCGLKVGSAQPSLSGNMSNVVCNLFNATSSNVFTVPEGITPGQPYLVRLDRGPSPYDPAKLSVSPVAKIYPMPQGAWMQGPSTINALNTANYPGARWGMASWGPEGSRYRYIFGGYGERDASTPGQGMLADLWKYDTITGVWTLLPTSGFYGNPAGNVYSVGTFDASNWPRARRSATAVYDPTGSGRLWLFGGQSDIGSLNDLWVYDLATDKWALMSGSPNAGSLNGVMGSFGVPAHSNTPGSRERANGWMDGGRIYIFGGWGFRDSNAPEPGVIGHLNDLWVFDPASSDPEATFASNSWAHISGSNLRDHPGGGVFPPARYDASLWRDNSGKIWLFGGKGAASDGVGYLNDLWSYQIGTNSWTRVGGSDLKNARMVVGMRFHSSNKVWPAARYAATSWKGSDGRLYLFGGDGFTTRFGSSGYLSDVWSFDPWAGQWTWLGGETVNQFGVEMPKVNFTGSYGVQGTSSSTQKPGSRLGAVAWPDSNPSTNSSVWIFGGMSNFGLLNDLWYLDF